MLSHGITILVQLALAIVTAAGWGFWIRQLAPGSQPRTSSDFLLFGMSGYCASCLFLQDLVYFDVRLQWSSWLVLAIALLGWCGIGRKLIAARRAAWPFWPWLAIGLPVFVFQASGLIANGPADYYGNAHQDQVNAVQISQFLVEKPFSTRLEDVGLHPWLVKPIDLKSARIGQNVANGYLAVVALTDSASAYGVTSIFFVALLAIVTFELLRRLGSARWAATLGAFWIGLLPAVTKAQLDGFLAQTATLFVVPALLLALLTAPRHFRLSWISGALFLGFLLSAYTELYIIAFAITGLICLSILQLRPRCRAALFALTAGGSLLAVAPYTFGYAWSFVTMQYGIAAKPDTFPLASLFPNSGTWQGWAEFFFLPVSGGGMPPRAALLAGMLLVLVLITGLASRDLGRRMALAAAAMVPLAVLMLLRSDPVFHKYAFSKLLVSSLPVAVVLITLGLERIQLLAGFLASSVSGNSFGARMPIRPRRWAVVGSAAILLTLVACAATGAWSLQRPVIANAGILATVNSPEARQTYRELEKHPERRYLIEEPHPIANAWLAYHARHSQTYAAVGVIGDRPMPQDQFEFRRLPNRAADIWLVTIGRIQSYANPQGSPELILRNPQGVERDGVMTWCWVGDRMQFEIVHFGDKPARYHLGFHAFSGLANPAPERAVSLVDEQTGAAQYREFTGGALLSFALILQPGSNLFTFRVDQPTEWLVHVAGDPRKHMVRIQEINLFSDDTRVP